MPIYGIYAQENNTTEVSAEVSKENVFNFQNASFSEISPKTEVTKEDILIEAQRSFDRSLSILNIVAALIGVLVTILAVIIAVVGGLGFFEIKRWKENRKKIEKDAETTKQLVAHIELLRDKAEKDTDTLRSKIDKYSHPILSGELVAQIEMLKDKAKKDVSTLRSEIDIISNLPISGKPPREMIETFDEFNNRLERLELLGISMKPEDYFNRGVDLYFKGKYELSIKAFEKVIELEPNNHQAWFMKATVLLSLIRYDEALKAIEKAIELKPDDDNYFIVKGSMLGFEKFKRYEEAIKMYEMAIELKPDNPFSWYGKGLMLRELSRFKEALEAFDKAIALNPDYAEAWYSRAISYNITGEKKAVLSNLKKAIEIDKYYQEKVRKDKLFEKLWNDEDFKKLIE